MARGTRDPRYVDEFGPGTEWHEELDGYKASIVEVNEDTDLTPLLQGLPSDQCALPDASITALRCVAITYPLFQRRT
jgi:hypothetical protein